MIRINVLRLILFLLLLCQVTLLRAEPLTIPSLTARVTDLTQTLDAGQKAQLEQQLAALELRKGAQLAVLLIPSVGDESIDAYAVRTFEQWKLGRNGIDDGVLLVIAKNDRKMHIEVGYGLEGVITDASAGRIIREIIAPKFRQGAYFHGIALAVSSLSSLIEHANVDSRPAEDSRLGILLDNWLLLACFIYGLCAYALIYLKIVDKDWMLLGAVLLSLSVGASAVHLKSWLFSPFMIAFGGIAFDVVRKHYLAVMAFIVYYALLAVFAKYINGIILFVVAVVPVLYLRFRSGSSGGSSGGANGGGFSGGGGSSGGGGGGASGGW